MVDELAVLSLAISDDHESATRIRRCVRAGRRGWGRAMRCHLLPPAASVVEVTGLDALLAGVQRVPVYVTCTDLQLRVAPRPTYLASYPRASIQPSDAYHRPLN